MSVEVPPELAGPVWVTLRAAWLGSPRNGGGTPRPGARELLDALRLAALQSAMSASGPGNGPTSQAGVGDTAPATSAGIWLGSAEAAARLGVTTRHVRRLAAAGRLPARRHGVRDWAIRLDQEDL